MKKFVIEPTNFDGPLVIIPKVFKDERGYFCESYNVENLKFLGFKEKMVQDNESKSKKYVLRGLHYQWDDPMGKLVRAIKGSILDVIVDIRKGSKTYGEHFSIILTSENKKQLWVPPGFAHGILSLQDDTIISYKCSSVYNQEGESGIDPLDPALGIDWGCKIEDLVLSKKDLEAKSFYEYDQDPKFL